MTGKANQKQRRTSSQSRAEGKTLNTSENGMRTRTIVSARSKTLPNAMYWIKPSKQGQIITLLSEQTQKQL